MNKQQLAAKIWESANKMRSKIEANEYKDYILGFIFYKFLSEKEVKYLKENDWTDEYLPDLTEEDSETVESVQKNLGYFISYDNLFSTWLSKGRDFSVQDVRDALSAFSRLINTTHKKVFEGVFDTLQTGLSKLGDSSASQSKAISDLIHLIKDIPMDGKQDYLEAAKIQGFKWEVTSYTDDNTGEIIEMAFDEKTYLVLVLRYKELSGGGGGGTGDDVPYDLVGYITEIDTGLIDADYMNSRFEKYLKLLNLEGASAEAVEQAETELHKTFATLSQEEQKYANIFLHDIQRGDVAITEGKTLRDYITEYLSKAKDDQIHRVAVALGVDEVKLRTIMSLRLNSTNINEFGRYDDLKKTVNKAKAKEYFEKIEGTKIIPPKVNVKVDNLLREFILGGGFEIEMPELNG